MAVAVDPVAGEKGGRGREKEKKKERDTVLLN